MAKFEIDWLEDRSDEGVLEKIRRVAALEPDRRLTKRMFDSVARIKSSTVERRFGSWSEASRRAGLSDALPVYSDTAIIEDLRRISVLSPNEPFTRAFYSNHGQYSDDHIRRKFGGWREALDAAGIGGRYAGPQITERMKSQPGRAKSDAQILGEIRDISARLGKASLTGTDIQANSEITQNQLFSRFGSVSAALRQAGVEQASLGRRYTEDQVFENLLEVWTHYGRPPTVSEMDRSPSKIGQTTYIRRYGGWRKALRAFIERANSEVGGGRAFASDQDPSTQAVKTAETGNTTASNASLASAQPAHQTSARPRMKRLTPTDDKSLEERRGPSIGLRFKVLQRDCFKCVLCGDHPARNAECILHVDHQLPFSKGGKTREDNLRTLCATCNIGRGNRFDD